MEETVSVVLRTVLNLLVLLLVARILGRRTLSQLTFYDFVVGITVGNIGTAMVTAPSASIYNGLLSLAATTLWVLGVNALTLKSVPARKLIEAEPLMVIYRGMILEENLKKRYYNVNDLLELLREQGIFNPKQVETAIIETDGQLSVLKEQPFREVTQQDLNVQSSNTTPALSLKVGKELILNGTVHAESLRTYGLTVKWLEDQLITQGVRLQDITVALLTPEGELYFDTKQDKLPVGRR